MIESLTSCERHTLIGFVQIKTGITEALGHANIRTKNRRIASDGFFIAGATRFSACRTTGIIACVLLAIACE